MMFLGSIVEQISGVTYQKSQASTEPLKGYKPILRAGNISASRILENDLIYIPENLIRNDRLLKYGDILIATSSGSLSVVGKAAMLENDMDAGFGAFCRVLRPNVEVVFPRYLKFFFETNYYKNTIKNLAAGANINNLKSQHFNSLEIPTPPLAEQKQIAAILDAADSLRQKDQQLVEHYSALSQSLFLEMFGDPVTNPKKWNTKYFSDVFITKTGKLDSNAASDTGMYPFFTCAKQPLKIDSYTYDEEALLLAGNNAAGIFDVKYYNGKFDAYQRTYILTIKGNELTYSFMKVALEKKLADLERLSIGSSTQYLTMQILKRLEFSVPPIQLQNQFAERIAIIEQQKQQAQSNLKKSEALFNSLLQRAFTGELTADRAA